MFVPVQYLWTPGVVPQLFIKCLLCGPTPIRLPVDCPSRERLPRTWSSCEQPRLSLLPASRALSLFSQIPLIGNWLCLFFFSQHFCFRALKDNVTRAHLQRMRRNLAHQQHHVMVRVFFCTTAPLLMAIPFLIYLRIYFCFLWPQFSIWKFPD